MVRRTYADTWADLHLDAENTPTLLRRATWSCMETRGPSYTYVVLCYVMIRDAFQVAAALLIEVALQFAVAFLIGSGPVPQKEPLGKLVGAVSTCGSCPLALVRRTHPL